MLAISVSPNPANAGSPATVTVTGSTCSPFSIKVVYVGDDGPETIEEGSNYSNPPPATLGFTPPVAGDYRIEVECGGSTIGTLDFTAV